jgi:DNA (cytosine-5)-methyltransferase 3A
MNVLSLFDGISVARHALGDRVKQYYASEIDAKAIHVAKKNFPDTIHLGDVRTIKAVDLPKIDLLIGGSPCQDLSIAKKGRKGLDGDRSGLFWEYVRILREVKPTYFVLENVASMPHKDKQIISEELGVEAILINASLVSAQSRKRLFWTNIPVEGLPADRGILLKDILEPDAEVDDRMAKDGKAYCLTATYKGATEKNSIERKQRTMVKISKNPTEFHQIGYFGAENACKVGGQALRVYDAEYKSPTLGSSGVGLVKLGHIESDAQGNRVYSIEGKSCTLSASSGGIGSNTGLYDTGKIRKLTPIECERLQSLPDNYTDGIANTHRYKCLGNAFNAEVVRFILNFIPSKTDVAAHPEKNSIP